MLLCSIVEETISQDLNITSRVFQESKFRVVQRPAGNKYNMVGV